MEKKNYIRIVNKDGVGEHTRIYYDGILLQCFNKVEIEIKPNKQVRAVLYTNQVILDLEDVVTEVIVVSMVNNEE